MRRWYQDAWVNKSTEFFRNGGTKGLIVAPTGSGKGQIPAWFTTEVFKPQKGEQVLVCVHRTDLVEQTVERIRELAPTLIVGAEQGTNYCSPYADVIVASVQTLAYKCVKDESSGVWTWGPRIVRFDPDTVRYIIIDEGHVAVSEQYECVQEYFNINKRNPSHDKTKKLVVITATPERPDGIGLDTIVDEIIEATSELDLMNTGIEVQGETFNFLVDIESHIVHTTVNLDEIRTSYSGVYKDFSDTQLAKVVNIPYRNKVIVEKYIELGHNLPAICFAVDRQHAKDIETMFNSFGVSCQMIEGKTKRDKRKVYYKRFQDGDIKVLVSAGVLDVGLDLPEATVAIFAAPTLSGLRFRQRFGRVKRPFPSPEQIRKYFMCYMRLPEYIKRRCIAIDFVDVCSKHELITLPSIYGLNKSFKANGKTIKQVLGEIEEIKKKPVYADIASFEDLDSLKVFTAKIELIRPPSVPSEIQSVSNFGWMPVKNGYQLCSKSKTLLVRQNTIGAYEVFESTRGILTKVGQAKDLTSAIKTGDSCIPPEDISSLDRSAEWKQGRPSEKHMKLLAIADPNRKKFGSFIAYKEFVSNNYTIENAEAILTKYKVKLDKIMGARR